jgi:DNA-binding winged helix-turn-helix (wHTH) protein
MSDARRLVSDGRDLHLTPKAYDLLSVLVDAAPRVVTKTELHSRVWPDTFVSDATLTGLIKEVRYALGDTGSEGPVLRTARRVGYAIAIPVERGVLRQSTTQWLIADGRSFCLPEGITVVGRDPGCGVRLDTPGVSRRHATITVADERATISADGQRFLMIREEPAPPPTIAVVENWFAELQRKLSAE